MSSLPRAFGPDPSIILERLESGDFTLTPPLCYPFCNNVRREGGGISQIVHFYGNFEELSSAYSFTTDDDALCARMFAAMKKNPACRNKSI